MSNTADVTGGKPIAVWSQSTSGVIAINPLVAFYDILGRKREVLYFYFVPDTTLDLIHHTSILLIWVLYKLVRQSGEARWPRGQCALRAIAEAKQHWQVIRWETKIILSQASPYFGRLVKRFFYNVSKEKKITVHSPIRTGSIPGQASQRVSSSARPASKSAVRPPKPRVAFHTGLHDADAGSVSTGGQLSLEI
jgi:hypothetical protein